jgi:hypothetical protein
LNLIIILIILIVAIAKAGAVEPSLIIIWSLMNLYGKISLLLNHFKTLLDNIIILKIANILKTKMKMKVKTPNKKPIPMETLNKELLITINFLLIPIIITIIIIISLILINPLLEFLMPKNNLEKKLSIDLTLLKFLTHKKIFKYSKNMNKILVLCNKKKKW